MGVTVWRRRLATSVILTASLFLAAISVLHSTGPQVPHSYAIQSTYTVTNTDDAGAGSLREAITLANAEPTVAGAPHLIEFAIPGGGLHTIALQTPLPTITNPTIINGTTQSGSSCGNLVPDAPFGANTPHVLNIELVSSSQVGGAGEVNILQLAASATGSTVKGLVLNGTSADGTYGSDIVVSSPNTTIDCNYFEVKADGVTPGQTRVSTSVLLNPMADNAVVTNNLLTKLLAFGTSDTIDNLQMKNNLVGVKVTLDSVISPSFDPGIAVELRATTNALIGGTLADANVVGNGAATNPHTWTGGISVGFSSARATIRSNYVGISPTGAKVANGNGIVVDSPDGPVTDIVIGGSNPGEGNFISGNISAGISISRDVHTVNIKGNYIGAGIDGKTSGVGNSLGIRGTFGSYDNLTVGGPTSTERNIISGNATYGFYSSYNSNSGTNTVQGNYIGLGVDGSPLGNGGLGMALRDGNNGTWLIGGSGSGEGNVIANNVGALSIDGAGGSRRIYGNIIGLRPDGETPAYNGTSEGAWALDLRGNVPIQFGGPNPGEGNTIAGNNQLIVVIAVNDFKMQGNKIGLTKNSAALPNGAGMGVNVMVPYRYSLNSGVLIGGTTAAEGNTIRGGTMTGVVMDAQNSTISHNTIYEGIEGIRILGDTTSNNAVTHNTIRNNTHNGISVKRQTTYDTSGNELPNTMTGNTFRYNSVYGNGDLGIDLGDASSNLDGVTANDYQDADANAPNNLQNYPVIRASMTKCDATTDTNNIPIFNSTPNTTFTIDYYANPSWNSATNLPRQGEQWVSSQTVTTDADGNATLDLTRINSLTYPSVTATDPSGNTSEFGAITTMAFTLCEDMIQRVVATTADDIFLSANWTGFSVPDTYLRNQPRWSEDYNQTTGQWTNRIEQTGLSVTVTVGGQNLAWDTSPEMWQSAYNLNASGWNVTGHTAAPLPEGLHDVVITVTDPISGLSMTKTYPHAVKVMLPKLNYTTVITNNSTPTLPGTGSGVTDLHNAYIIPQGSPAPNPSLNPGDPGYYAQRVARWVPTQNPDGSDTYTGSFKIITSPTEYITLLTQETTTRIASEQSSFERYFARDNLVDILGSTVDTIDTLAELKATCSNTAVQQRLIDWLGATITSEGDCQTWFQTQYDTIRFSNEQILHAAITAVNNGTSGYDFSAFTQGTYDMYILGYDVSFGRFTSSFPRGLTIDFTKPTATLTTPSANAVSPQLNGSVSDPTATITITLTGQDGKTYGPYAAQNNGDGTWTLRAGTIQPGLVLGAYTVTVTTTSLAGNTSTETKTLHITADAKTPTSNLANTGATIIGVMCSSVVIILLSIFYKRMRTYRTYRLHGAS